MGHFRNACVNNWYDKSSYIVLFSRISWYIVSINLFLSNSGNIRFKVKLICHSHCSFENYVGFLVNIFSQKLNIFNICIDILVCINKISWASLTLLRYSTTGYSNLYNVNIFKFGWWAQELSSFNFAFGIPPLDINFFKLVKLCVGTVNNFNGNAS